ncbi:MAG: hypothetical protein ABJB47_02890 [Actinomycetota bacterium]
MWTHHWASASFGGSSDALLDLVEEILTQRWRAHRVRRGPGSVSARTRMSWRSWGETIQCSVAGDGAVTTVTVASRPSFPGTLYDYRKNQQNVTLLLEQLQEGAVVRY